MAVWFLGTGRASGGALTCTCEWFHMDTGFLSRWVHVMYKKCWLGLSEFGRWPYNCLETPRRNGQIKVFLGKKVWGIGMKAHYGTCNVCGYSMVTAVLFQWNGFPRHDLALLLGAGCGGQQWQWRGSSVQVLIADKGSAGHPVKDMQ